MTAIQKQERNKKGWIPGILLLLLLMGLYGTVGYRSYGYDDEYYTIANVESYPTIAESIMINNSVDIHPPGSYLICLGLWKLTDNWHLVRMISGLVNAVFIWLFWTLVVKADAGADGKTGPVNLYSFLVTCLNPAILMWGTSIRWFTYVIPCVCLLGILMHDPLPDQWKHWGSIFGIYVLIFYLENTAAIIIVVSFLIFLYQRRKRISEEFKAILTCGGIATLLVLHQAYVFFAVRLNNYGIGRAKGGILIGILYGAENILTGQAVMPVSVWGICLIIANILLFVAFLANFRKIMKEDCNKFFLTSYVLYMVSGLGALRNYSGLFPLQGSFLSDVFRSVRRRWMAVLVVALTLLGTAGGVVNAVTHQDTTKTQWNMPFAQVLDFIDERSEAAGNVLVFSKDPALCYLLREKGYEVIQFEGYEEFASQRLDPDWESRFDTPNAMVFAITTYDPDLGSDDAYRAFLTKLEAVSDRAEIYSFGYDRFAWFKRYLDGNISDHMVSVYVFEE